MATIHSLNRSITQMNRQELFILLNKIRARRRTRPPAKKAAPAKVARAPSKKAPKQQDLFALAKGMTSEMKAALAAQLLGGKK